MTTRRWFDVAALAPLLAISLPWHLTDPSNQFPDGDRGVRASIASASKHREARLRRAGIDGKRVGPREG